MKNKRHLILFILMLFGAYQVFAQRIGGGLMIGPAFSTMKISGNDSTQFRPDLTGGVRIALIPEHSIFGAEIDVIYSRQGTSSKSGLAKTTTLSATWKSRIILMCHCSSTSISANGPRTTRTNP